MGFHARIALSSRTPAYQATGPRFGTLVVVFLFDMTLLHWNPTLPRSILAMEASHVRAPMPPILYLILSTSMASTKRRSVSVIVTVHRIEVRNSCTHDYSLPPWLSQQLHSRFRFFVNSTSTILNRKSLFTTSLGLYVDSQTMHSPSKYQYVPIFWACHRNTDFIQDPSSQFRIVTRVWRFLTSKKRLGQAHGIDSLLSHRRPGNLIVYCPACPDPHLNMEDNWENTPDALR